MARKTNTAPQGLQSKILIKLKRRQTPMAQTVLSMILSGKRRATPEQAVLLEPVLAELGFPISKVDMVFNYQKGVPLLQIKGGNI